MAISIHVHSVVSLDHKSLLICLELLTMLLNLSKSISEPYTCTGNFQADYMELCQRSGMMVIPPVNMRPKLPSSPVQPDAAKPDKGKDKGKAQQVEQEPDLDHTDDGA